MKEIFNKIISKIKSFFYLDDNIEYTSKKEGGKAEYLVPLDERTIHYLPKWAQEEIAQWRARARVLEEEVEQLKKKLEKYEKKIEDELYKEIVQSFKIISKLESAKKFPIILRARKLIRVKAWDGGPIYTTVEVKSEDGREEKLVLEVGWLKGIILEQTEYGPYVSLLCTAYSLDDVDEKKPFHVTIPLGPLEQLPYVIYDFRNLVEWLSRGELILYIDRSGKRIPYYIQYRQQETNENKDNNETNDNNSKYLVLDNYREILNQYPELKDVILSLYDKVNELLNENAELKRQIEELKDEYAKSHAELVALKKHINLNRTHMVKSIAELGESYKYLADAISTNLQLSTRIAALETSYMDLLSNYERIVKEYIDKTTKLPDEISKEVAKELSDKIKENIPLDIIEFGIKKAKSKKVKETVEEHES